VAPKYCSKPSRALKAATAHQAPATADTRGPVDVGWFDAGLARIRKPIKAKAQAQEKSKGMTAGDGPSVNGLSQGSVMSKNGISGNLSADISDIGLISHFCMAAAHLRSESLASKLMPK
jgi:hypothetical protein